MTCKKNSKNNEMTGGISCLSSSQGPVALTAMIALVALAAALFWAVIPMSAAEVLLESNEAILSASLVQYDPAPVAPGSYMTVWIQLSNLGNNPAPYAAIEFLPQYPFSIDGSDTPKKSFRLGSQQDYIFEYKLRVDGNAVTGTNKLRFRYTFDSTVASPQWKESTFDVSVRASTATLTVMDVKTEKGYLSPGMPAKVDILIKNTAGVALKNIEASLDLFTTVTASATSTSTSDIPIAPIGTSTQQYVDRVGVGEEKTLSFMLAPYPDAVSKLYKIPLTITFEDEAGNDYEKEDLIGIFVSSPPDITAFVESSTVSKKMPSGIVSVKLVNQGLSDLKFMSATLKDGEGYSLASSSDTVYVGNLDSDDFETVEFSVKAEPGMGELSLPVEVAFLDALNRQYKESFTLTASLTNGNGSSSSGWVWAIVLIALAGGAYWYMRRKKRK